MSKCQEAIKELNFFVHSELDGTRMLDEYLKYCDTLQELVDKATPKKVINRTAELSKETPHLVVLNEYSCPVCNSVFVFSYRCNYCKNCGQKLDWSEKDE